MAQAVFPWGCAGGIGSLHPPGRSGAEMDIWGKTTVDLPVHCFTRM